VFAEPSFGVTQSLQFLDQPQVALQGQGWVIARAMVRSNKDAKTHYGLPNLI
jgi:hypothetical protein